MDPRKLIYGGADPRALPCYTVSEAAHHVKVAPSTLRLWIAGSCTRETLRGPTRSPAVIEAASKRPWILSFWNLIEAQMLVQIRRKHRVSMQKVRKSLDWVKKELQLETPLIEARFATDGVDLFVENFLGDLVNPVEGAVVELTEELRASLKRIEHDEQGLASSFYPWAHDPHEERIVKVDPETAFGKPVVAGTAVPTSVLAGRYRAGDSYKVLARDYALDEATVRKAVAWERLRIGQVA